MYMTQVLALAQKCKPGQRAMGDGVAYVVGPRGGLRPQYRTITIRAGKKFPPTPRPGEYWMLVLD